MESAWHSEGGWWWLLQSAWVKLWRWKCLLKWLTAGQLFSLLLSFFLSLVSFQTMVPEIGVFYKYQLHKLFTRKTATLSQAGGDHSFGRYYVYSRVPPALPPAPSLFPVPVSLHKSRYFWCQLREIPHQSLLSLRVQIKLFSGSVKVS